ncbi:MAG: D-alanine--D-alanine ligase [Gammaproteobacteria bacterium]|nr:D-alanine--D-alanine ligase [Gammaproteobacteria bacterium]
MNGQAYNGRYGKVAVLVGGRSAEREISLQTGAAILAALCRKGVDAHEIDAGETVVSDLVEGGFDRVFNALHGRGGEDGVIQGTLEALNLPYTGSGVLGSALSMDKVRCKWIWQRLGLPTPEFKLIRSEQDLDAAARELGLPLMLKPVHEGSSLGAARVAAAEDLAEAWANALRYDDKVICERWMPGGDYTVGILHGHALPAIKIETDREFYDYHAKYLDDDTRYLCPCGLPQELEAELAGLALQAFDAIGAGGWGRVDIMLDQNQRPGLIDVNTVPGMTGHSLVPMAASRTGLDFDNLVLRVLDTSIPVSEPAERNW